MKVTMTLNKLNALGAPFGSLQKVKFETSAMAIYEETAKFLDKFDTFNEMLKKYRTEHAEDKKTIEKYPPDQKGNPVTMEIGDELELDPTPEWVEYEKYFNSLLDEEFTIEVTPVIGKSQATKLSSEELRVADKLGIRIKPADKSKKKGVK